MKVTSPFNKIIDTQHILTPVAIERFEYTGYKFKALYILGIRVMTWRID